MRATFVVCVAFAHGASAASFAARHGLLKALPDPKVRNAKLQQRLDQLQGQLKGLEEQEQGLLDMVKVAPDARSNLMGAAVGDQKALEEEVATLRKERAEKAEKCNTAYREAHAALGNQVRGVHKATLLHAGVSSVAGRQDPAVDGDRMQYIEDNKILEQDVNTAKSDVERLRNAIARYQAELKQNSVNVKHLRKIIQQMKATYRSQKAALKTDIRILDRRCAEAEDINKGLPAWRGNLKVAANAVERVKLQTLYDWKFLGNSRQDELIGRDDERVSLKPLQAQSLSFDDASISCAGNDDCESFCWNPDDWTTFYKEHKQGYRNVGNYGAGWKCFAKKTKDTFTFHYLKNDREQELKGRDDDRAILELKGHKESFEEAEAKCAAEVTCNYFCWNPDDWTSYYPKREQGYRQVGSYGAGWKCYNKLWQGEVRPEPLARAKKHVHKPRPWEKVVTYVKKTLGSLGGFFKRWR